MTVPLPVRETVEARRVEPCGGRGAESVWNDRNGWATGGGFSTVFSPPSWQTTAGVSDGGNSGSGRGVPDVAADADGVTGYAIQVDSKRQISGGTSAVAPLWAALAARLAENLGRPIGLLQPRLYASAKPAQPVPGFHDISEGANGLYQAGPGWDACTGLGTPVGTQILQLLKK